MVGRYKIDHGSIRPALRHLGFALVRIFYHALLQYIGVNAFVISRYCFKCKKYGVNVLMDRQCGIGLNPLITTGGLVKTNARVNPKKLGIEMCRQVTHRSCHGFG